LTSSLLRLGQKEISLTRSWGAKGFTNQKLRKEQKEEGKARKKGSVGAVEPLKGTGDLNTESLVNFQAHAYLKEGPCRPRKVAFQEKRVERNRYSYYQKPCWSRPPWAVAFSEGEVC